MTPKKVFMEKTILDFHFDYLHPSLNGSLAGDHRPWAQCWEIEKKEWRSSTSVPGAHLWASDPLSWVSSPLTDAEFKVSLLAKIRVKGHSSRIRSLGRVGPCLLNSWKITPWWDIFPCVKKVEFHRLQKQARSSARCSRLILKIHRKAEEERGVNIVMF